MYQQYPDMYVFNPGGVTPIHSTMYSTNTLHPELVGNLNRDNTGVLWMTLMYKSGVRTYILSYNIMGILMYAYSNKNSDKKFVTFILGNSKINVKYSDIRGYKLLDKLTMLGVEFAIDAPKNKKADTLNTLVIKSILRNGFIPLDDDTFKSEYKKEDVEFV